MMDLGVLRKKDAKDLLPHKPLEPCSAICPKRCASILSEKRRQEICNEFHSINFSHNYHWLKRYVVTTEVSSRSKKLRAKLGEDPRNAFSLFLATFKRQ